MPGFDVIASTLRGGVAVDEVEFEVAGAPPATAYLLGRRNEGAQPVVIALHDERGDKASLLPDLEHLAGRGFLCLSTDSPVTRRASADRDPVAAFENQFLIATTVLNLVQGDAELTDHRVALLGRGLGGEVAASVAAHTYRAQVVVAINALPDRSNFIKTSAHPLAAGLRQFHDETEVARQIAGLTPRRLIDQFAASPNTHWLVQVADDDDRLSPDDQQTLAMAIPRTVRVDHVTHRSDLTSVQALRTRVDFVSRLCG